MAYSGPCAGELLSGEEWACVPGGTDWAYPITIGLEYEDADADGFASWEDCDDADAELGSDRMWWPDGDGDGVGGDSGFQFNCADPGPGWSERSDDCNDADFFAAEPGSPLCPSGGSGGVQVTCCEVSAACVVGPVCWAFRRRRRGGPDSRCALGGSSPPRQRE
ncbi:hypothetical protein LBMAG42_08180 [Deltaproteobacteria bacterium]|nr:hypothetical protein LBMAG42_08180 [Deltaproteobacteria bacterium]